MFTPHLWKRNTEARKLASKRSEVSPRSRARVLTISALYQLDLLGRSITDVVEDVRSGVGDSEESLYYLSETERAAALDFFESLLVGTWDKKEQLDERLRESLENWSLERVGNLERAILRLGCHEILHREDIPRSVSINEMVELSKSFCDHKSKEFINGVLDSITP